jgi:hypothetical protein
MNLEEIFTKLIYGTPAQSNISVCDIFLCSIEPNVHHSLKKYKYFLNPRSYTSTINIKHSYDRRPRFTTINIGEIENILRQPDFVLKDNDKKGDFIFVRRLKHKKEKFICCPIEITPRESGHLSIKCITFFPTKSRSYLRKFPTLWDREGGHVLHRDTKLTLSAQQ